MKQTIHQAKKPTIIIFAVVAMAISVVQLTNTKTVKAFEVYGADYTQCTATDVTLDGGALNKGGKAYFCASGVELVDFVKVPASGTCLPEYAGTRDVPSGELICLDTTKASVKAGATGSSTSTPQASGAASKSTSVEAGTCSPARSFFGLPTWYKYLDGEVDPVDPSKCVPKVDIIKNPNQLWGIGLAFFDILLRLAGLVAVAFVIYGGFLYIVSQGESDKAAGAKNTIMNALIGLVIVIISTAVISFLGNSL